MRLHELSPKGEANKKKRRKGRGIGSVAGKNAGRGDNGQNSRSGGGVGPGFEGGQMPLHIRVPKKGFINRFKKEYAEVNIKDLDQLADGTKVTPELLIKEGFINELKDGVKILGDGELTKNLTVNAHKFTKSAQEKIEKTGGKVEVV